MDIYAKKGTKVVFANPNAGYDSEIETAAKYLTVGNEYTIEKTEVGSWHTVVWLQEHRDIEFNSVQFDDITTTNLLIRRGYEYLCIRTRFKRTGQ